MLDDEKVVVPDDEKVWLPETSVPLFVSSEDREAVALGLSVTDGEADLSALGVLVTESEGGSPDSDDDDDTVLDQDGILKELSVEGDLVEVVDGLADDDGETDASGLDEAVALGLNSLERERVLENDASSFDCDLEAVKLSDREALDDASELGEVVQEGDVLLEDV